MLHIFACVPICCIHLMAAEQRKEKGKFQTKALNVTLVRLCLDTSSEG